MPSHGKILGRAERDVQGYNYNGAKYTFVTSLEITKAKSNGRVLRSCYWVEARFSLKGEDDTRAVNVGHLYAYLVDKDRTDASGAPAWRGEILTPLADPIELQTVLQELYTPTGRVRQRTTAYSGELQDDRIVFIDTLVVSEAWQGKGIAQLAVPAVHRLLPRLNRDFAFDGTIVLCPAASQDYRKGNDKTDVEIENALIGSYSRSGYDVWLKGDEAVEGSVTVMGIVIAADEQQEEAAD